MFVRYFTQIPPMTPATRGKPTLRRKWRKPLWGQHEVSKCSPCAPSWKKTYGNIIEIPTTQTSQNSWQGHCKHGLYDREAEGACSSCTDWRKELLHCLWSAQGDLNLKCSIQSMCFFFSLTSHGIALQNSTISTLRMLLVCPPILMSQRWKILNAEWKIHKSMLRTSRTWPGLVQPAFWTSLIVLPRARAFLI